jgi:PAS domain-containing protein
VELPGRLNLAANSRPRQASIGDAVIATDAEGRVTYLNGVTQRLTGWDQPDAHGRPLESVFIILGERTRRPIENPVGRVLHPR